MEKKLFITSFGLYISINEDPCNLHGDEFTGSEADKVKVSKKVFFLSTCIDYLEREQDVSFSS